MNSSLIESIDEAIKAAQTLKTPQAISFIESCIKEITKAYSNNNKLLIAGNGGSLCDSMHFAEELTGQFRKPRKALPAIALSDPAHMSCTANDYSFAQVFARGVEAFGSKDDIFILLTTSGNSENLLQAVYEAKKKQMKTIAFLGKTGGKIKGLCDLEWIVKGFPYSDRIQEAHMAAIHIIIENTEKNLFPSLYKELCHA